MTNTTYATATSPTHLMELFSARAATGDLEGLLELYEADAVFEPAFGVTVVGHGELRTALPEFLQLRPQITYTSEPDVVIVDGGGIIRYVGVGGDQELSAALRSIVGEQDPDGQP